MIQRLALSLALFAAPVVAQAATLISYGGSCASWPLSSLSGLPSLGTTFTLLHAPSPGPYSQYFLVGNSPTSTPISLPGVTFGVCPLLVNPFTTISGSSISVAVPNNTGLIGAQLYFQGFRFISTQWFTGVDFTQGIEATVGL